MNDIIVIHTDGVESQNTMLCVLYRTLVNYGLDGPLIADTLERRTHQEVAESKVRNE